MHEIEAGYDHYKGKKTDTQPLAFNARYMTSGLCLGL